MEIKVDPTAIARTNEGIQRATVTRATQSNLSVPAAPDNRTVGIEVIADRAVYINALRIAGGPSYTRENLPSFIYTVSVDDVLNAFSFEQLERHVAERKALYS